MHPQMIGNLPLSVSILLYRLVYLRISFPYILKDFPTEEMIDVVPVHVALAFGYLRNFFMPSDIINGLRLRKLSLSSSSKKMVLFFSLPLLIR